MHAFPVSVDATVGNARALTLQLARGTVRTPVYMPVGTMGAVRSVSPQHLAETGTQILLANTYHLYLRPGHEVVRDDIILVSEGDRIPADARLLSATNLSVDESLLTGESRPVLVSSGDRVHAGTVNLGARLVVRVDAVGFQGHLQVNRSYDWDSIKKNIRRFKDLGLEVYIAELDVSMGMEWKKGDPFPKDYEQLQAERFYGIVKAAREAGVHRIDVWGLSEAVNQYWLVGQQARLFDEQFQPRATYQAVLKALYDTQE